MSERPDAAAAADADRGLPIAARLSGARCAFCHDALDGDVAVCPGCRTILHVDCGEQLAECPTLGCRFSVFTLATGPGARPPAPTRPAFRRALAELARARRGAPQGTPDPEENERPALARALPLADAGPPSRARDRCFVCYAPVVAFDFRWECPGCENVYHQGCRALLRACRGCARRGERADPHVASGEAGRPLRTRAEIRDVLSRIPRAPAATPVSLAGNVLARLKSLFERRTSTPRG